MLKKDVKLSNQAGDVQATCSIGENFIKTFTVECKHYKSLHVDSLIFDGTKDGIINFWGQVLRDSKQHGTLPMLIAKQNNRPDLLVLCTQGIQRVLETGCVLPVKAYIYDHGMHVCHLKDFLSHVRPESFL